MYSRTVTPLAKKILRLSIPCLVKDYLKPPSPVCWLGVKTFNSVLFYHETAFLIACHFLQLLLTCKYLVALSQTTNDNNNAV